MRNYYHVTVLSNFSAAFEKYSRTYDKTLIQESSFPGVFFLLQREELMIGVKKANKLLDKLALPENKLIVLETQIDSKLVRKNDVTQTKLGVYVESSKMKVYRVYYWNADKLEECRIEDVVAASHKVNKLDNQDYTKLIPRSISFLPVAKGCQAKCAFCFSTASISSEMKQGIFNEYILRLALEKASKAGASRAVITGGGEPGLLSIEKLNRLIRLCGEYFSKVVLITNGYSLVKDKNVRETLNGFVSSGLSVLSVSRHHYDREINSKLMSLDIDSDIISQNLIGNITSLTLRWICVLQKGGIDTSEKLKKYIDWTFEVGVTQICFKELYVSSSTESVYYNLVANDWSYKNQVPLSLVINMATDQEWELIDKLPWGSPVYRIRRGEKVLSVAAYTEPSVFWELSHGQCRSWNVMSNGECYTSLESKDSIIDFAKDR